MTTISSWLFRNNQGKPPLRYEGDIKDLPGVKWVSIKGSPWAGQFDGKQPCILVDGMLHYGEPEVVWTPGDEAPCSTNCKNAKGVFCSCSCKGKNHGINNRDMANAVEPNEVVYTGWES